MQYQPTRRAFTATSLGSLLSLSLFECLLASESVASEADSKVVAWLKQLDQMGRDLQGAELTQLEWQDQTEDLFSKVDLKSLLAAIDFEKLAREIEFKKRGEKSMRARLPDVEGLPKRLVFGHQIFGLKQGQSVVPHGHNNMATAFLVLQGEFQGRHYDRLETLEDHFIIKPTIDERFEVGGCSTVSDHKDNVHWFKALSETGFIFNIHVLNIEDGIRSGRVYVDPEGEKMSGGRIKAPKLNYADAYRKYG